MTVEARVLFVLLFFAAWAFMGLIIWASVAVLRRGDGAIFALPVSLAAACAGGVALPLAGLDDGTGLLLSLVTAMAGSLFGYAFVLVLLRRFAPAGMASSQTAEMPPRE
jgi:hypothetical protein